VICVVAGLTVIRGEIVSANYISLWPVLVTVGYAGFREGGGGKNATAGLLSVTKVNEKLVATCIQSEKLSDGAGFKSPHQTIDASEDDDELLTSVAGRL
jgi:hypothetical protein